MSDRLRELGADVVEMPATQVARLDLTPLREAIGILPAYNWLIFTSQNAVSIFWEQLLGEGRDARALSGLKIGAVGPVTAGALLEHGIAAMQGQVRGMSWRAPPPWLESLFGMREAMPSQMGLWVNLGGFVMFPDNAPNLSATPIDNPAGSDPLGLRFHFSGLELIFLCTTSVRSKYAPNGRFRPGLLTIESPHYCTVRIGIRYRYSPSGLHLQIRGVNSSTARGNLHL